MIITWFFQTDVPFEWSEYFITVRYNVSTKGHKRGQDSDTLYTAPLTVLGNLSQGQVARLIRAQDLPFGLTESPACNNEHLW